MALQPCPECGEEIPKYAKICLHCGVENPFKTQKKKQRLILGTVSALIIISALSVAIIAMYRWEKNTVESMDRRPGTTTERSSAKSSAPTREESRLPEYHIVSIEDVSYGRVNRQSVRIGVPKHYSKSEIENISRSVTSDITSRQDVNAVIMYFHGPNSSTSGIPDVARVEWAPYGDWGSAHRVRAGDYSSFRYAVFYNPKPTTPSRTLARSSSIGLLGAPIPAGAKLIERTQGNPSEGVDPRERYQIEASAEQILGFYRNEMPKAGWKLLFSSTGNALFYRKDNLELGILTNRDGLTFTLIGS